MTTIQQLNSCTPCSFRVQDCICCRTSATLPDSPRYQHLSISCACLIPHRSHTCPEACVSSASRTTKYLHSHESFPCCCRLCVCWTAVTTGQCVFCQHLGMLQARMDHVNLHRGCPPQDGNDPCQVTPPHLHSWFQPAGCEICRMTSAVLCPCTL